MELSLAPAWRLHLTGRRGMKSPRCRWRGGCLPSTAGAWSPPGPLRQRGGGRRALPSRAAPGPAPFPRERSRQRGRHQPPAAPLPQPPAAAALPTHLGGDGGTRHPDTCPASPGQGGPRPGAAPSLPAAPPRCPPGPARPGPGSSGGGLDGAGARGSREGRPRRGGRRGSPSRGGARAGFPTLPGTRRDRPNRSAQCRLGLMAN